MRSEQALREAAGLEQGVAQQNRIAHAPPDGRGYVVAGCGDALHQHGIDAHADHNEEGLEAQGQQGAKVSSAPSEPHSRLTIVAKGIGPMEVTKYTSIILP